MNENEKARHQLIVTFAGFHCICDRWKIGSWNGAHDSFAAHVARAEKEPADV